MLTKKSVLSLLIDTLNKLDSYDPNDYLTRDTFSYLLAKLDTIVSILGSSIPLSHLERISYYLGEGRFIYDTDFMKKLYPENFPCSDNED